MPYITTRFVFCSVPQQQGGVLRCSSHRDTSVGPIPADCSLASWADECVTFSDWRVLCQHSICCLKSLMCQLVLRPLRLRDLTETVRQINSLVQTAEPKSRHQIWHAGDERIPTDLRHIYNGVQWRAVQPAAKQAEPHRPPQPSQGSCFAWKGLRK